MLEEDFIADSALVIGLGHARALIGNVCAGFGDEKSGKVSMDNQFLNTGESLLENMADRSFVCLRDMCQAEASDVCRV